MQYEYNEILCGHYKDRYEDYITNIIYNKIIVGRIIRTKSKVNVYTI